MATGAVVARILSQYSDKGSKQAQKDIKKLGQNIDAFGRKATRSFALVGAATAAFASKLAIDAVKGAAADEKQQAALAVALRNTTNATDAAIAANSKYLDSLELQVAIDNEKLIPALQQLVTATGDLSQAQGLLSLATDVSAASGKDLGAVSMALSKAVNGNFSALTKLGLPLDAAAIKSKDLGAILVQLARISAGQAEASANTFSGTLEKLRLSFNQIADSVGYAMIPALTTFALYLQNTVIPQLDYFVFLNEYKLQQALITGVENIKEIVRAFTNIYNVIQAVNNILPFGIAGWIQIGVALSIATKLGMLYNATFSALAIVSKAGATALTQAASAGLANAAAQGANATGSAIAAGWMAKLSLAVRAKTTAMIADTVATYRLSVSTQLLGVAMKTGAGSVSLMNIALIRLGATLKAGVAFLAKYFKQILVFIAAMEALDWVIKKITGGNGSGKKLSESAQDLSYEFWKADKATTSMDDALNAYRATQDKANNKTKEQIELEKLLSSMKAKSLAEDKKKAKFEADYAKINARIAKNYGVKLVSGDDEKLIQVNAAEALLKRQEKLDAVNLRLLDKLKEEVLLLKVKNDLTARYDDILKVLSISEDKLPAAIAVLAAKWGTTVEAVEAYILQFKIVQDGKISDDEVTKLAMSWGSTKEQAAKYLDFFVALNDGVLDTIEIEKLKTKWSMTEQQVRQYADFVGVVNDGKLTDVEIVKLQEKWKLSTDQVVAYIKEIGSPVSYSGTLIDPARAAEIGWKNALAALQAYQAALGGGTTTKTTTPPVVTVIPPKTDGLGGRTDSAAEAASKAAAAAYAASKAAGDSAGAAIAAAGVRPSDLASGESGAIGAASIAAQLRAAEQAKAAADAAARQASSLAAFKAKEAADLAASQAAAIDYDERFRFRNSLTMDNSKSLMAGGIGSGSNTTVNVTVNGTVQTEQDLVYSIRQGLLAGQTNGQGLVLQAI